LSNLASFLFDLARGFRYNIYRNEGGREMVIGFVIGLLVVVAVCTVLTLKEDK